MSRSAVAYCCGRGQNVYCGAFGLHSGPFCRKTHFVVVVCLFVCLFVLFSLRHVVVVVVVVVVCFLVCFCFGHSCTFCRVL